MFLLRCSTLLFLLLPVNGLRVIKMLTVSEGVTTPDGVEKLNTLEYNGQYPGPTISAQLGDELAILVWNNLTENPDPTAVHWHGMFQKGTQFQDGPSMVTQCPIQPNQTQMYNFQAKQSGTYWYHAHYKSQYTDGLIGPLVIYDPSDPAYYGYEPRAEILIVISDWYLWGYKINEIYHTTTGIPPFPSSALINGRGQFPCEVPIVQSTLSQLGLKVGQVLVTERCDTKKQTRSLFNIKPGSTVRIRVINSSAMSAFTFSIDSHKLSTIEVDGVSVAREALGKPVDYAYIGAAQRYSFLVKMDQKAGNTYNIRAVIDTEFFSAFSKRLPNLPNPILGNINLNAQWTLQPQVTAGLVYATNKLTPVPDEGHEPFTYFHLKDVIDNLIPVGSNLDEFTLLPRDEEEAPSHVDVQFNLSIGLTPTPVPYSLFNGKRLILPDETTDAPLLMQLVAGRPLKSNTNPLYIPHNQVAQFVIFNKEPFAHPLHLHGNTFWLLGKGEVGEGPFNPKLHGHRLNVTTVKRDTAVIRAGSWMVIRMVGDNPGVWIFHCHLDWHNSGGMGMTVVVAPEKLKGIPIPEEAKRVCRQRSGQKLN